MLSDNRKFGCVLNYGHTGECYGGARGFDCHTKQLEDEIARLRAENAALQAQIDDEPAQLRTVVRGVNDRDTLLEEVAKLRAARLRPGTVDELRVCLLSVHGFCVPRSNPSERVRGVLADLNRAYPEEE